MNESERKLSQAQMSTTNQVRNLTLRAFPHVPTHPKAKRLKKKTFLSSLRFLWGQLCRSTQHWGGSDAPTIKHFAEIELCNFFFVSAIFFKLVSICRSNCSFHLFYFFLSFQRRRWLKGAPRLHRSWASKAAVIARPVAFVEDFPSSPSASPNPSRCKSDKSAEITSHILSHFITSSFPLWTWFVWQRTKIIAIDSDKEELLAFFKPVFWGSYFSPG